MEKYKNNYTLPCLLLQAKCSVTIVKQSKMVIIFPDCINWQKVRKNKGFVHRIFCEKLLTFILIDVIMIQLLALCGNGVPVPF